MEHLLRIPTDGLEQSMKKLEKLMEEHLYDAADHQEDIRYDEWRQAEMEREQESEEALNACKAAGVEERYLMTLAREAGCVAWALKNSLKGA